MRRAPASAPAQGPPIRLVGGEGAVVSDEELLRAAAAGERWAPSALLTRYGPLVERLIRRVLGHDHELEDLVQETFVAILSAIGQVRDGAALRGWIASVAVHTAHRAIRRRQLNRWFYFWRGDAPRHAETPVGPRDAVRRVYDILDRLPAAERVVLALRLLDEMPLEEIARVARVSLATVKRRLARAEKRFVRAAERDPVLVEWMEEGDRWKET